MLVRAAGTGSSPHTALINVSTDTGRLRFINNTANTARCFAGPNGTSAPLEIICNGPRTPNPSAVLVIALVSLRVCSTDLQRLLAE
ncbi:hypothetical protein MBOU_55870 [Mycobacterium bourgelatii]|uniref:Uncharacterized protein n=1 Tax=Mycobacterium bourgelatii TaxID=1273442 RepID=A0A7I9YY36_MYCBU|nr:hypothetical protein MBOU_55870 [Mycobacterium bourgelatii]